MLESLGNALVWVLKLFLFCALVLVLKAICGRNSVLLSGGRLLSQCKHAYEAPRSNLRRSKEV